MQVVVRAKTLEDGSKVYDVEFGDTVVFECVSFRAACCFCDELAAATKAHTNTELDFYWRG